MMLNRVQLLHGIPDDRRVKIAGILKDGSFNFALPGSAIFALHLPPEITKRLDIITVNPWQKFAIRRSGGASPLVNYIADADRCMGSLQTIKLIVDDMGGACFNHPNSVLNNRRHIVSKSLSGIDGLHVPRTELIEAIDGDDLLAKIQTSNLAFPLILRVPGYHAGYATKLVRTAADLPRAVYSLPAGGKPLYVTEFVDCRDSDGFNRKLRLAVIGRQVFARHYIAGEGWNVHVADRMNSESEAEARILDFFPDSLPRSITGIASEIANRLGLDYFGIDCCPRPDGSFVFFEANAAMDILRNSNHQDPRWNGRIHRIRDALVDLLFNPLRWRHQGTLASQQ